MQHPECPRPVSLRLRVCMRLRVSAQPVPGAHLGTSFVHHVTLTPRWCGQRSDSTHTGLSPCCSLCCTSSPCLRQHTPCSLLFPECIQSIAASDLCTHSLSQACAHDQAAQHTPGGVAMQAGIPPHTSRARTAAWQAYLMPFASVPAGAEGTPPQLGAGRGLALRQILERMQVLSPGVVVHPCGPDRSPLGLDQTASATEVSGHGGG